MAIEYINRITVKNDGVYISHKSSNDSMPFRSFRNAMLSEAYEKGGQRELDRTMIELAWRNTEFKGNHPSVERYKELFRSPEAGQAKHEYRRKVNEAVDKYFNEGKDGERQIDLVQSEALETLFDDLADICAKLDKENVKIKESIER